MTEKKYERYYGLAGKASYENWDNVKSSQMCGCYYCCRIFPSSEVTDADWVPDAHGRTVVCPYCGIDSVLGDASPIPVQGDVLEELHEHMFGIPEEERAPRCVIPDDCGDLAARLGILGMETVTSTDSVEVLSGFIPDFYCFSGSSPDHKRMASELRANGTTVLWLSSPAATEPDTECAGLSDIILLPGGNPTDTRLADGNADRLFVRTLGKAGLLYRFRDGAWKTMKPASDEDIDFDAAALWTAAGIINAVSMTRKAFSILEEEDADFILSETVRLVVDAARASAL